MKNYPFNQQLIYPQIQSLTMVLNHDNILNIVRF